MDTITIKKNKLVLGGAVLAALLIGIIIGLGIGMSHNFERQGGKRSQDYGRMERQGGMPQKRMPTMDSPQVNASGTLEVTPGAQ